MFQYYFVTGKLGRSLNWLSKNLCFLHSNMMFMHLDAVTTISRDSFYCIFNSIKTSESRKTSPLKFLEKGC